MTKKANHAGKFNYTQCTNCGLPDTWGITILDKQGICNYCHYFRNVKEKLRDFDHWNALFKDTINRYRGKYEYDAVVGFSGGKDSSFIVHMLQKHYQARVLAVTVDFGFMPSGPAKENIKRVVNHLGVDHINYKMPADHVKTCFGNAVRKGKLLCEFCTTMCWLVPRKIAIERHVPFYIMGSDRGQMFRGLSPETAPVSGAGLINMMLTPYSEGKTTRADNPKFVKGMQSWLHKYGLPRELAKEIYPAPVYLPGTKAYPLNLQFFLFHRYQEKVIKQTLANEAGWELPGGDHLHSHHDCILHDAAMYFFREATGTTMTAGEICVDVREGEIRRREAVDVLTSEEKYLDEIANPYHVFEQLFGIDEIAVNRALKSFRRRMMILKSLRKLQMKFKKPKLKSLENL